MIELCHYTHRRHVAPILTHGLYPSARFHHLGLEMRRNVVYCWLSPEHDRMGYAQNPEYDCLTMLVEPDRCLVADMELATLAYQHLRGVAGKPQDAEQARYYALQYQNTAVPIDHYRPGLFSAPEVLVKESISSERVRYSPPSVEIPMREGESIQITALRYDGTPYRWWPAKVERITPACVVTYAPAGTVVHQPDGDWQSPVAVRAFYWTDRLYNLSEIYAADREKSGLYVHIASVPQFVPGGIRYRDHELDVSQNVGQPAKVLDEDEFAEAVERYGYSADMQAACRGAVTEALQLVDAWIWPLRR